MLGPAFCVDASLRKDVDISLLVGPTDIRQLFLFFFIYLFKRAYSSSQGY